MKSGEPSESAAEDHSKTDATTRRSVLGLASAVGVAGLAGCTALDVATGEPAEFSSGTATVADGTLSETGYGLNDVFEETLTREVEVVGSTREVRVTNTTAEYDKAVELLGERYQAAVFAAVATPRIEVLGQSFNPVADLGPDERAALIAERYGGVSDLERGSEYTTDVLGSDADVVVYAADGEIEGTGVSVELEFHVGSEVQAGGDYVLPLAAYPASFGDGENVRSMMNGLEHEPAEGN